MIGKIEAHLKSHGFAEFKFLNESKNKTEIETAIKILKTEVANVLAKKTVVDKTIKYDEEARGD